MLSSQYGISENKLPEEGLEDFSEFVPNLQPNTNSTQTKCTDLLFRTLKKYSSLDYCNAR
jgi:hypothetical protein